MVVVDTVAEPVAVAVEEANVVLEQVVEWEEEVMATAAVVQVQVQVQATVTVTVAMVLATAPSTRPFFKLPVSPWTRSLRPACRPTTRTS